MEELKVGIIGLGVGEKHIASYNQHRNCKVVALCDFRNEKLAEMARKYPDMFVTKHSEEIINDPSIKVVSITSFDNYHYEQVMAALRSGKHVMVEKPLCLNFQEAEDIRKLLDEHSGLKLSSNLVLRTCPRFMRIRNAVRSGEMGRIFYIEGDYLWGRIHKLTEGWRKDMDYYSIVSGAAIHMIDLILWMVEMRPLEVTAYGNRIATDDSSLQYNSFTAILMQFKDGSIAKVTANGGSVYPHFHRLAVFGTKKTAVHDREGAKWIESSDPGVVSSDMAEGYPAKKERCKVITSFVDSILDGDKQPIVSCDDAFDTMSVCFAVEDAMRKSKAIKVNYL